VSGFWSGVFGALVSSAVATLLEAILIGREARLPPDGPRRIRQVN
jgi:hypothetical protein